MRRLGSASNYSAPMHSSRLNRQYTPSAALFIERPVAERARLLGRRSIDSCTVQLLYDMDGEVSYFPQVPPSPASPTHIPTRSSEISSCQHVLRVATATLPPNFVMATLASTDQKEVHSFFEKLAARAEKIDSLLCVGLDPHAGELGDHSNAAGARAFCLKLIESTSSFALAYKPNSAFFEEYGVSNHDVGHIHSRDSLDLACLSLERAYFGLLTKLLDG